MIRRLAVLIVIAVSLSACATVNHIPLSPEASAQLKGKNLTTTRYATPDFSAFTAGKAAFALLGAAAMIAEGNEIVRTNSIEDPALKITQGLVEKLAVSRGMTLIPNQDKTAAGDDISVLLSTYPKSNYLLDIKTLGWMFNYYPADWAHYRVTYGARLRLIDSSTKKVVAETSCQSVQGDDKNPPTKDQLLDNKAALLKEYLGKAASACVEVLSKEVLRL
jgi:hypothetical protein